MRRWLLGCVLLLGACAPLQDSTGAAAEAQEDTSQARFVEEGPFPVAGLPDQQLTIWLPPGYDQTERTYPVLYMHDGHNLFDPEKSNFNKIWAADKAVTDLAAKGVIEPHIIVGIWAPGADRYRQYLPQFAAKSATGAVAKGIRELSQNKPVISARYLEWIADELKPRIDATYRTRPTPANTAIAGSSMGGLMSCYAIIERPDIFGRAACVSSHWPVMITDIADANFDQVSGIWDTWLADRLGEVNGRRIWMDHGTATLDQYYAPYQAVIDRRFTAQGWQRGEHWRSEVYDGAPHEENAWAERLPEILSWLLAKE